MSFAWRLIAALVLVLVTYNPAEISAYHWVSGAIGASEFGPIHLLLIAVLLIGWAIFWFATWRALDILGVTLAALLVGAIAWLLIDLEWIRADSGTAITWIAQVCMASILAIGVSWSHLWRRMTGQYNIDDVDE